MDDFTMTKRISLEELRKIQLNILDKIHEFCKENNIRYSLGGGTLLGAIRHKGYIPWDDDIDIMLPRPDYEKFIQGFVNQYSNLCIQTLNNDDTSFFPFAKVYDNRTILIEDYACNGIYVDIFPVDGLPPESELKQYIEKQNQITKNIFKTTKFFKFKKGNKVYLYIKYLIKKLIYPSREKSITILNELHFSHSFDHSLYAGAIVGRYAQKEHMEKSVFLDYIEVPFENRTFMAIKQYDAYLTKHYGDYMKLPPKEKQVSWHNFDAWWKD